ncbi:hypothetical protein KL864_16685 [Mycolicibacterium goodii]|uniref:hypothetical protein n=1 Tax=Mycolicibacterium goodii TaxID=134601 RepID=UPI001BDC718C|nr:hypothetical protein [Mycolicibacterium goodii]MBU8817540.1 hypothetical protein [Mycolicibacterium goodii]
MRQLFAESSGLLAASAASGATAAEVAAGAAAEAVPMTAVLPGTASPVVVASTARIIEHGVNKLAVSALGSAMVAAVAAAYAETGLGYETVDLASAAKLAPTTLGI